MVSMIYFAQSSLALTGLAKVARIALEVGAMFGICAPADCALYLFILVVTCDAITMLHMYIAVCINYILIIDIL